MVARLLVLLVVSGTAVLPAGPALASTADPHLCSVEEWRADPGRCLGDLHDVGAARVACLKAPTPDTPDSGLGGWFATRPEAQGRSGIVGPYTISGYAGYSYTTYDIGCAQTLLHPDYKFENTVANGEFLAATAIIGASNALRERAWDPGMMWGWADPLVREASQALYHRVFTVFGVITLAVVGAYLLWRSRQAQLNSAVTTAGWALLVMVVVTALAAWPSQAANLADRTLVASLNAIHDAVGPPPHSIEPEKCVFPDNPGACVDHRPPALRASDNEVETMLYRNWLRGLQLADPASWTTTARVPALNREPGPPVPQPHRPAEPQRPPGRAPQRAEAAVPVSERPKEPSSPGYAIYRPGDESSAVDGPQVRSEARADAG